MVLCNQFYPSSFPSTSPLVLHQIRAQPSNFLSVPLHKIVPGQCGSTCRPTLLRISLMALPCHRGCCRAYLLSDPSSGRSSPGFHPRCRHCQLVLRLPFLSIQVHLNLTAPSGFTAYSRHTGSEHPGALRNKTLHQMSHAPSLSINFCTFANQKLSVNSTNHRTTSCSKTSEPL